MPFEKGEKIVAKPVTEILAIFDRIENYKKGVELQFT